MKSALPAQKSANMRQPPSRFIPLVFPVAGCGLFLYIIQYISIQDGQERIPISENKSYFGFFVDKYSLKGDTLEVIGRAENPMPLQGLRSIHLEGLSYLINQAKEKVALDDKLQEIQLPHSHYFRTFQKNPDVNCDALFRNDSREIMRSVNMSSTERKAMSARQFINMTLNCSEFKKRRGYVMSSLSRVEEEFPIAYTIQMFKDVAQSERLLRAIYRPEHLYCIHVDKKSDEDVYLAMANIASCFENIFMSTTRVDVEWGHFTLLEADLICMNDLWNRKRKWKYLINLTGQEYPLRTNYELVQVLRAYGGANDLEGTKKRANRDRWENAGVPPPHSIEPVKGSVHVIVSRGFVDFMLHDNRSLDLLEWTKNTSVPDETYFSTLNHNTFLRVPGSPAEFTETDDSNIIKPFVARFKNWSSEPCYGQYVRTICVFGSGDLPVLAAKRNIIANKFYWDYQHALDCMEELIFNRTRDQYHGKLSFDPRWYAELGFVKNQIH